MSAKGQAGISRYGLYFVGVRQTAMLPPDADEEPLPLNVQLAITFKDVRSLEIVNSKKMLMPDSIQIGLPNNKLVGFIFLVLT